MKIFPLDFFPPNAALIQPKDQALHDAAVDYALRNVAGDVNLGLFLKVFVAAEHDEQTGLYTVEGLTGCVMRPDISLFRATSARATAKLHHRWHTFFADNGILGQEVLLHLSDKDAPEQRCANWKDEMLKAEARPADRYLIKVKGV